MTAAHNRRNRTTRLLVTVALLGLAPATSAAAAGDAAEAREDTAAPVEQPGEQAAEAGDLATTVGGAGADTCRPSTEALLVRGIGMFQHQKMLEGLVVLAEVVRERPEWRPAQGAYAGALLRSGRFREAAERYAALIGKETARLLARGELAARDLVLSVDPEHVLGLAIARHHLGDVREADPLYRSYADLVEPTSERAARAYLRLSEMYSEVPVSWGDAEAERAKALAVDPLIETRSTLPDVPDLEAIPETEPYTREIALAPDRTAPEGDLQSLPTLIDWTPPAFPDVTADTEWERADMEILVGVSGHTEDLALPADLDLGSGPGAALADAATAWCFEPAMGESAAVAAWITFGVDVPAAPADSLAEAAPDSAAGRPGDVAPGAPPRKEGERPKR